MGNKSVKEKTPQPMLAPKQKKPHYFPTGVFFFGVVLTGVGLVSYFEWYTIPYEKMVLQGLLFLAGLWIMKTALIKGAYARSKDVLKRYL